MVLARNRRRFGAFAALAMLLPACGSSGGGTAATSSGSTTTSGGSTTTSGGSITTSAGSSTTSGGATTASPGSTTPPAKGGHLVAALGGGSYQNAFRAAYLQPFSIETGIKFDLVQGDNGFAAIEGQEKSGNVLWDVVVCDSVLSPATPQYFEPIDRTIVKSTNDLVYPEAISDIYVVSDVEANPIMAYSTKAFPNGGPQTWADFFDTTKFPGKRGVPDLGTQSGLWLPAAALLADGVTPDKLFPLDLDRAYKKLNALKPSIGVYWTSYSQSQDILRSGETVINMMSDGRALQLLNANQPVAVSFSQGFRLTGVLCVLKGAPHKEEAFRFLEYILAHPEQQAIFASLTYYGPPTKAGVEAAKAAGVKEFSSLHVDQLIPDSKLIADYVAKNGDELLARWNAFIGK